MTRYQHLALAIVAAFTTFSLGFWANISGSIWVFALAVTAGVAFVELMVRTAGGIGLHAFWPSRSLRMAKWQLARLFDLANWEIRIISDDLLSTIYKTPRVRQAIEDAITRGVHIKVIVKESESAEQLLSRFNWLKQVSLWHTPHRINKRLIIVDGVHVQIGDRFDDEGNLLRGFCFYFNTPAVRDCNQIFEQVLLEATAVTA